MRAMRVALAAAVCAPVTLTCGQPVAADSGNISAIGNEAPIAIAVSPLYPRTHMVAAISVPVGGCSSACVHLWITRDGGASWQRRGTAPGAAMVIVATRRGAERLVTATSDGVIASEDDGATWQRLGPAGAPSPAPALGSDALLVAGYDASDYSISDAGQRAVVGSGGTRVDLAFGRASLLVARDRTSGLPVVMRCDAAVACTGTTPLPGATQSSGNGIAVIAGDDSGASGVAYVRTESALYRTADGGRSFLSVPLPPHAGAAYTTIADAALGAGPNPRLYAALLEVVGTGASRLTAGGVFATTDGGLDWSDVGNPSMLDGGATAVAAAPDGRLFAGFVNAHGLAGLACSDGGAMWHATCGHVLAACTAATCSGRVAAGATPTQAVRVAVTNDSNAKRAAAVSRSSGKATNATMVSGGGSGRPALPLPALLIVPALAAATVSTLRRRRRRRGS